MQYVYQNSAFLITLQKKVMVKKIVILVCIFISHLGNAQMAMNYSETPLLDFKTVEVQPQFPGGFNAFLNYIQKNFSPNTEEVSGTLLVDFIIDINGFISSVKIKNDVANTGKLLAKVLEKCPKWDSGEEQGHKTRVLYRDLLITIKT
jgi:hypothetical protein